MILFTFENNLNTAIKTEAFTSVWEQFTCSDVIPTCPILTFYAHLELSFAVIDDPDKIVVVSVGAIKVEKIDRKTGKVDTSR